MRNDPMVLRCPPFDVLENLDEAQYLAMDALTELGRLKSMPDLQTL